MRWIAVATALVFGLVVRPALLAASAIRPARTALVVGALGLLSLAVFWSRLPAVLAGAAVLCAEAARSRQAGRTRPLVALGLAAITVAGAVALAIFG